MMCKKHLKFDPRTKIFMLLISALITILAPNLESVCILILGIGLFGIINGIIKRSLLGIIVFISLVILWKYYFSPMNNTIGIVFTVWLSLIFKLYPGIFMAMILLSTTKVNEFICAMHKTHLPQTVIIPLAIMIRYVPTIQEDWRYIKDAMKLRNLSPNIIGFIKSPGLVMECFYVPIMMAASKVIDELTIASITRGITNTSGRTNLVQIKFELHDFIVITVSILMLIMIFWMRGR